MTPNTTRRLAAFAFALSLAIHFAGGTGATAPQPPGALSFSQAAYEVNEGGGSAAITLTRGGGTDGAVTARVGISNVTTNAADYRFTPGALDATFTPGTGPNNVVHDVLVQPDGKILIAGFFRSYAGVTRNNVARLLPSGALDTTFDPQLGPGEVFSMALQPDGKLVVGGVIFTPDGSSRNGIGRLNADGSVDATFTPGGGTGNHGIDTIALRPDGKILIGGNFVSYDGVAREGSARLNADGTLDPSFVPPAVFRVFDLLALPDNKVIVCGFFSQIAGVSRPGVARLNEDGSHDLTFVPDAVLNRQSVSTLARQPDGKIIVGGVIFIDQPPSMTSTPLARLNADGSFDPFFFDPGLGRLHFISAITLQPDGKVIVGGAFRTINNPLQDVGQFLHRLNTNGTIDGSFNSGITAQLNSAVEEVALQPDGKLVVGGQFTQPFPGPNVFLRRLQGDLFVTWPDGDAADKTVNLPIVDDLLGESAETLTLTLTPHTGGATTGTHPSATLTIIDNEVAPAITSAPPPGGITRTPYTHTFTATGSPAPTFSVTSGSLPPGLFLNPATGVLSGSPTAAGTFSNITVTAGNGVAPAATQTFSLNILSGGTLQFGTNALSVSEDGASATVTVTRNGGSAGAAAVNFSASNGTASGSGVDFTLVSGTLGFAEGETSKTFAVQITNDDVNERDETLNLFLSSVTGSASLGSPSNAVLTITNDDPLPTISIDDVVVNESDTGVRPAVFTVSRAGLIDRPVSFTASPADGTARANEDYAPFTFTFQIAPNTQSTTVIVNIAGDTITEPDENFVLNISAPINATIVDAQGAGEVKDNESPNTPPTVQFAAWNFNAPEADGAVNINVTRSGDISAPATVLYTTLPGPGAGAASERADYTLTLGSVSFAAGEAGKTFTVFITDDAHVEPDEFIQVALSGPTGGTALGTPSTAVVRIVSDDDAPSTTNPSDDSAFFVRQHYRDFLGRDPDEAGLRFWTNEIESCGADQQCREVKRVNVSAAFFLSIEFQNTGYLVYRLHKSAFNTGERLPLRTFLGDAQEIRKGVIVGELGWEQKLEQNKQEFLDAFVQRASFTTQFPQSTTPAQFVDALNANTGDPLNPTAGGSLTPAERDQLVAELTSGARTRAQVLRAVAENEEFRRRLTNKAFVLMQYFGYLRRAPNSAPDVNFDGYNFWLDKLEQFNGNFVNAEMVKAFISSIEYRQRFGQ